MHNKDYDGKNYHGYLRCIKIKIKMIKIIMDNKNKDYDDRLLGIFVVHNNTY